MNELAELAREIILLKKAQRTALSLRRGVIVSVGASTAVVTIDGEDVADVPFHDHVTIVGGDTVDVLYTGPSPRIIGRMA